MENYAWVMVILSITIGILIVLYLNHMQTRRMNGMEKSTEKGLDLKVDESLYKVAHEY